MVGRSVMLKRALALSVGLLLGGLFMIGESRAAASGQTQTNSGGGVTIKVIYQNPKSAEDVRFQVALDTHSVDLDAYDLKAVSLLRDEAGKTYELTRVENKGSGHHRQVVLVFPRPSGEVKRLELVLKDIAGVKERSFRWDLSQ
ncbi:MAG: hypothetical protein HY695_07815 [Deltaproteobacteria bacterium]|nr:hypothetical protein [Deltaproteobacteria bacterium]